MSGTIHPHSRTHGSEGGVLNVNKPGGMTSFAVVKKIRSILNVRRVGHCGTLDPMAEGVLVVVYGTAASRQEEWMSEEKVYLAEMRLGIRTDTGDITGTVLETSVAPVLDEKEVKKVFQKFTGELEQVPPMFAAIKFRGRKLYDYARKGIEILRPPRKVTIQSLTLLNLQPSVIEFRVACSKGTYIRSLVEDMGRYIGAPATLGSLTRERSGSFKVEDSIPWETLVNMKREELILRSMIP